LASSNRQAINKGANKPNLTKRESNYVAPSTVFTKSKDQKGHKSPKQ
jgi:hypothetical protein